MKIKTSILLVAFAFAGSIVVAQNLPKKVENIEIFDLEKIGRNSPTTVKKI